MSGLCGGRGTREGWIATELDEHFSAWGVLAIVKRLTKRAELSRPSVAAPATSLNGRRATLHIRKRFVLEHVDPKRCQANSGVR
jgi:hypothetical protein